MKKLFWSILCIASLLASCSEIEIDVNAIEVGEDFTATVAETRAELDGVAVLWNEADELTIFTKTAHNRHYRVKSLSNGNRSATFGYVSYSGNDNTKISNNYAVYPYDADATLSGEVITTKLNAEQVYNAEKVDLANALMVAKSTSTALQFVNATSLMRFDVSNNMPDSYTLSSIKLVSAANKLAGEVTIDLSADSKAVVTESGVNEVTLSAINCEISAEKQSFYVVLPATTFAAKDLTVTFTYAEGVEKSFQLPAFELELGSIKTIAYTINDGEDFEGSTPDSGEDFEGETPGAVVKPANNEIWYTTTDGNVIELYEYDYCFGANIVSNTYVDGKGVIKFDSDATQLIEAFESDETLLTVTLPDSVKKLGSYAFSQCPNLTTINFGDGVTSFEDNIIYSCPSLSKFTGSIASKDGYSLIINGVLIYVLSFDESVTTYVIPEGVLSFYINGIGGSSNITEIVIPNSIVNLNGFDAIIAKLTNVKLFSGKFASEDGSCLIENSNLRYFAPQALALLTSYNVPNGVTKISTQFPASSTLSTVTFADGITEVAAGLLNKCPNVQSVAGSIATADGKCIAINNELIDIVDNKLTSYTIPEGITAIGYNAFSNKNIESITVAKSVNTIKNNAFSSQYIKEIYFKSTTPATISGSLFNFWIIDENIKLYVLTSAVDAYKSAWSDYASYIVEYSNTPANNEIWYTTTDGNIITPTSTLGLTITSNTYVNGKGVMTFSADVTSIPSKMFHYAYSLSSVTIPDSVKYINTMAFSGSGLKKITIGEGVADIDDKAFNNCSNLEVYCKPLTPPTLGSDMWSSYGLKIYVPTESLNTYKKASGWMSFASYISGYDF
ncbi:MAG: leucine-rich repeat protein [Alistipes sp.]|nr:leucine-rich repeat protein [Alistipes sp.]